jgi:hypothetical protein
MGDDDDLDERPMGGVESDLFLHLVDAWAESKLGKWTDARVDGAIRKLDTFTDAMGDRFEDAAHLERAYKDWEVRVGAKQAKACVVVAEVLVFWKQVEEMDKEERLRKAGSATSAS